MEPLVSVIIPVFQVEKYLARTVDSVLRQTFGNMEIILVVRADEESPDACPAMCEAYVLKDGRVRVIHQEDTGLSEARNAGMKMAKGDYIYFLDADDCIREDAIALLLQKAQSTEADIVLFGATVVDENDQPVSDKKMARALARATPHPGIVSGQEMMRDMMCHRNHIHAVQFSFFNRTFLLNHALSFYPSIYCEDALFTFITLMRMQKTVHLPEQLLFYRIRSNSLSRSPVSHKNVSGQCIAVREILNEFALHPTWAQYKEFAFFLVKRLTTAVNAQYNVGVTDKEKNHKLLCETVDAVRHTPWIAGHLTFLDDFAKASMDAKRLIFYGAGQRCKELVSQFKESNQRLPNEIWDQAAPDIPPIDDIPIMPPAFETLKDHQNWMLIICVADLDVIEDVKRQCFEVGFKNVYGWWVAYEALVH